MLVRFVVKNFLSFGEEREFNMLSSSLKTHKHHVYPLGKISVLKSAAIYGANGAGKSNLIKAIEFLQETVSHGGIVRSVNDKKFKLDKAFELEPISFEIELCVNRRIYAYGISLNGTSVIEEFLYESGVTIDDKLIFERRKTKGTKHSIKLAENFQKTKKQKLLVELMEESLLKDSELFLSKSVELKNEVMLAVREHISSSLIVIHPGSKFQGLIQHLTLSDGFRTFANDLLQTFDTGVAKLDIESVDFEKYFGEEDDKLKEEIKEQVGKGQRVLFNTNGNAVLILREKNKLAVKKVVSSHINCDGIEVAFDLHEESDGTQRLLDFIPAFDGILQRNFTFIIDEIDQSLHPALLKALVRKIMADSNTKGQLIFTTHESNLLDLDIFRQDEIWFVEKENQTGQTHMYSLMDFKPRYDLDIRKGYLKGRFGAIPFLGNLEELQWEKYDA